jgi:hypothetical protein
MCACNSPQRADVEHGAVVCRRTDTDLRAAMSTWLTLALDTAMPDTTLDDDLIALREWVDGGCAGDMPVPTLPATGSHLAETVSESIRVYWETRYWSAAQFRRALVEARLR